MSTDAKRWSWADQLAKGKAGEVMLMELANGLMAPGLKTYRPSDDRRWDLLDPFGRKIEVKTDLYDHTKTPNLFVEWRSGVKPAGPWRAANDGVDSYVHWFPNPKPLAYWFHDVPALVKYLDEWLAAKRRWGRLIRNRGWSAIGYVIERAELTKNVACDIVQYEVLA